MKLQTRGRRGFCRALTWNEVLMGSPLFLDMIENGKILFNRDDFFASICTALQRNSVPRERTVCTRGTPGTGY